MGKSTKEVGFDILANWLDLRLTGNSLNSFFTDNRVKSVAIYGMGKLGKLLLKELQQTDVNIVCAIDKNSQIKINDDISLYGTEQEEYPGFDVLIVTPTLYYWEIVRAMETKVSVPIISLEDIVEYCYSRRDR